MTAIGPAALPRPTSSAVRYNVPVQTTADVAGNATFVFPDVPASLWVVASATIASAPVTAAMVATVTAGSAQGAGQPWGVWNGPAPSPVIQIDERTHLTITAQFLQPFQPYTAWLIGWADNIDALLFPEAQGSAIPAFNASPLQPQTTTQTIATATFGPYAVASSAGVRFSAIAESLFSNALVDLRWYDSQAIALAPGLFDAAGVFDFTVTTADSASFIIPNLGDWLVVKVTSADAGNTRLHWSLGVRQSGFDVFGQGKATGVQNVDAPAGSTVIVTPPVNGPWYRFKHLTGRVNGTPAAGLIASFFLSDDGIPTPKAWAALSRTAGVANEVPIDTPVDFTIANPTRLCVSNGTAVDMRVGAVWEVVPPLFDFPRDS